MDENIEKKLATYMARLMELQHRKDEMIRMRKSGMMVKDIAEHYGLTRQRVWQITGKVTK